MKLSTILFLCLLTLSGWAQIDLPVTFEDAITYDLADFGGNGSSIVADPTDPGNMVAQSVKSDAAELWAGTSMGEMGFVNAIPLAANATKMSVRVWSPDSGIPIRLKVEDSNNNTISVETEALTTLASEWETLEFDFSSEVMNTAAINFDNTYDKASIFFNFGTTGAEQGEKIYYWDDVILLPAEATPVDLPITFEDANTDYVLEDFGGNASSIVVDPTDATNMVVQSIKTGASELWAGTTVGNNGFANPIPFTDNATKMTVRVWSPDAGIPVRVKVEDATNNTISVETEAMTTMAGEWETLEFDFSSEVMNTAAINFDNTYDKASIFFNFGTTGAEQGEKIYYWDDVEFVEDNSISAYCATEVQHLGIPAETASSIFLTITNVDATSMLVEIESANDDPVDLLIIPGGSGAMISGENTSVPGKISRTLTWMSPPADVVLNVLWSKESSDGNWQLSPMDISLPFAASCPVIELNPVNLPITFEDANVDYALADFGGNASSVVVDPTDAGNMVVQSIKTDASELWAGTTAGNNGFADPIPFTADDTKMTVRVWSPDAGIPVRVKVEDATNNTISVETEAMTTVAGEWETLEFDFSNEVLNTAAINFDNTYDKASLFFNFGTTGAEQGEKTYYWDDVEFVEDNSLSEYCVTEIQHLGIPAETASAIFLTITNVDATSMLVEVESANDDPVDLLIVANGSGAMISAEEFSVPGKISRTLTWMSPPADVVLNVLWSKESSDGNWQLSPMEITVPFAASCPDVEPNQVDLPITFEDANTDYALADFGGNASSIVVDPTDAGNMVVQSIKTDASELWAGTTVGNNGFANPIPFTAIETQMSVRVWSPDAGIPVRLKVEDATNNTISVETEAMTTVAGEWETLEFDFTNQVDETAELNLANTYDKASIFFNFGVTGAEQGEKTYYWDDVEFIPSDLEQIDLPVTFEDEDVNYDLTDFGGNASSIVEDPTDATNTVAQSIRTAGSLVFAGTSMGAAGFANPVPFSSLETKMSVRVWSPLAGVPVRLKVEDANEGTISVETETSTTVAMEWETLEFNFSNPVVGTPSLNLSNTYNKATIFFNFGAEGADEQIYYWDDVEFIASDLVQIDLPVTFEEDDVFFDLVDFAGAASSVVEDPTDATNTVAQTIRTDASLVFAGTSMGIAGFANAISFTDIKTKMSVRVWSPEAGVPIRLKVENATNGAISVETETSTSVAMEWETIEFDFNDNVEGTPALDLGNIYDKATIFFNFGAEGSVVGEQIYYWDDVELIDLQFIQIDLPVTFQDDNVFYDLADFGGNTSTIIDDATDPGNIVAQSVRGIDAETFAGTSMGTNGFDNPIPFEPGGTKITVRVWSPQVGTPVRLKVENATDGAISVETEAFSTVADDWETLEFDFLNQVDGTPALNFDNVYEKASIFFNFGVEGSAVGEQTFFWDDVFFIPAPPLDQVDLPVTFEESNTDYNLVDFAGAVSEIVPDPTDPTNTVAQSIKTGGAETFAGTTIGGNPGFANPIPFTADETKMTVWVWSPDANIPVRLKVEDANDPTISVETEATVTVAGEWQKLEFDFSNEAAGTAELNLASTYNKASIFFNFGTTGADAGEKTYYWDDVEFGDLFTVVDIIVNSEDHETLEDAVIAADLVETLSGVGPFTVFAPTDDAFDELPEGLLEELLMDPMGDLTQILLYHVLGNKVLSGDLSDGQMAPTVQGESVTVSINGMDVMINQALVTAVDLEADNGVVHVIDAVLVPNAVGTENLDANDYGITIAPNPAKDHFTIQFPEALINNAELYLYNANGQLCKQTQIRNAVVAMNANELDQGVYLIRIESEKKTYYTKLVIAK